MQKGTRREKIPTKHCVLELPPSLQELLIPTKAELVTPTVTIGIAAKPPPQEKSRKKKPQNKLKDKIKSKIKSNNWRICFTMIKKAYCSSSLASLTLIILFYKNVENFQKKKNHFFKEETFMRDKKESEGIFLFHMESSNLINSSTNTCWSCSIFQQQHVWRLHLSHTRNDMFHSYIQCHWCYLV